MTSPFIREMRKILAVIVIILIVFLFIKGWWGNQLSPVSTEKSTKIIVIENGENFSKVADDLKKQNLIKNSQVFGIYAKQSGLESKILPGTFRLSPSMSSQEILRTLTSAPLDNWVTLIEGWRIEEMAAKLNVALGISNAEFTKIAKEGYMFPDTYLFPKGFSVEQVVKKLRDNFDAKYSDEIKNKIKKLGLTESEGVILASIVEREGRSDGVRKMIASILLKRLNIEMGLNADATIQYALVTKGSLKPPVDGWWKRQLTHDDLKIVSPYNTYIYRGLPPTPICNPSLSSLQAVADADPSTPYLYYYHDSEGNSHYGKTLEEHNLNVANYP